MSLAVRAVRALSIRARTRLVGDAGHATGTKDAELCEPGDGAAGTGTVRARPRACGCLCGAGIALPWTTLGMLLPLLGTIWPILGTVLPVRPGGGLGAPEEGAYERGESELSALPVDCVDWDGVERVWDEREGVDGEQDIEISRASGTA